MSMMNINLIDRLALVLASCIATLLVELLNVSGKVNYSRLLLNVILLSVTQLITYSLFAWGRERLGFLLLFGSIFSGLVLWSVLHTIVGVYLDWGFVDSNPSDAKDIHIVMFVLRVLFIPFYFLVFFATVYSVRRLSKLLVNQSIELE